MQNNEIKQINPSELVDYKYNAKKHPPEQITALARAFKEEGFHGVIVVDEDNVILAGHGRKYAAIEAGLSQIPVQVVRGLTAEQKKSKRLGDNKLAESDWEEEFLKRELDDLIAADYDVTIAGFDESFLQDSAKEEGISTIPDADLNTIPLVDVGQTFALGRHRLHIGNSTDPADFILLTQNEKADLIVTDPPYNVNYEDKVKHMKRFRPQHNRENSGIQNDKLTDDDFYSFLLKMYKNCIDNSKDEASIYVFYASIESVNFICAFEEAGWEHKQILIWKKNHFVLGRQDYQWIHEPILYGWKQGYRHHWNGDRCQSTVLDFDKPQKSDQHPTMKPLDLIEYLIKNSSTEGQIVLDPFGGSGTTLLACEQTNRICYTMELEPRYAQVIIERWCNLTGQEAYRIEYDNTKIAWSAIKDGKEMEQMG